MPDNSDKAHKFVREALQAYPEIYFSRLVILGEGDSEEIILPRILQAKGIPADEYGITIAPLGGRHVNHFWLLLSSLKIPYITLLDLDVSRYQGGWGRIKYINDQIIENTQGSPLPSHKHIPEWNSKERQIREHPCVIDELENRNVFFSSPMDIDFSMLTAFQDEYGATPSEPSESNDKAALGKNCFRPEQYSNEERQLFESYAAIFKRSSKPAAHIEALSKLKDKDLLDRMPKSLDKLADAAITKLRELPE